MNSSLIDFRPLLFNRQFTQINKGIGKIKLLYELIVCKIKVIDTSPGAI